MTTWSRRSAPDRHLTVMRTRFSACSCSSWPRPAWWADVALWTYQSCRAFLTHLSVPHASLTAANGRPLRAVKLGSCWGGWDCNNPSYHAPAHYRIFGDYMSKYDSLWPTGAVES